MAPKSNMKSVRVLISLPERTLNTIDEVAESEQRSRSELIREAIRTYLKVNNISVKGDKDESESLILED